MSLGPISSLAFAEQASNACVRLALYRCGDCVSHRRVGHCDQQTHDQPLAESGRGLLCNSGWDGFIDDREPAGSLSVETPQATPCVLARSRRAHGCPFPGRNRALGPSQSLTPISLIVSTDDPAITCWTSVR